jgi:hypothetical protein
MRRGGGRSWVGRLWESEEGDIDPAHVKVVEGGGSLVLTELAVVTVQIACRSFRTKSLTKQNGAERERGLEDGS